MVAARLSLASWSFLCAIGCGGDETAPRVVAQSPAPDSTDMWVEDPIVIELDEALDFASVTEGTIRVEDATTGRALAASRTLSEDETVVTILLGEGPQAPGGLTVTVEGVSDHAGNRTPLTSWNLGVPLWNRPGGGALGDAAQNGALGGLTLDGDGRLLVAWSEADGASSRARASRLDVSGWTPLGDPSAANVQGAPVIAVDDQARPVLVWMEGGLARAARFDGTAWTALPDLGSASELALAGAGPAVVLAAPAGVVRVLRLAGDAWEQPWVDLSGARAPAAAVSASGSAFVAWIDASGALRVSRHDGGSGAWTALGGALAAGASAPSLTLAGEMPVVAWHDDGVSSTDAWVAAWDGGAWGVVGGHLDLDLADDARWPRLTAGAAGPLVTWQEVLRDGRLRLYAARLDEAGRWRFVGGQALNLDAARPAGPLAMVVSAGGRPIVAWHEEGAGGRAAVQVKRFNGGDEPLPGLSARPSVAGCAIDVGGGPAPALSMTGCFDLATPGAPVPHEGMVPYDINVPFWTDGATKKRWLVLPDGTRMEPTAAGGWTIPAGTLIVKEFDLLFDDADPSSKRPVETRFLVKRDAFTWEGYSFQWSDDLADATLLPGDDFTTKDWTVLRGGGETTHAHYYPGRMQCLVCHSEAAGVTLSVQTGQLNRRFDYGDAADEQLRALESVGLVGPGADAEKRFASPLDGSLSAEQRVRGYLAASCAHCHRPGGIRPTRDFRWETPLADMLLCVDPPEFIPGDPASSLIYLRIANRPGMPPIGTLIPDPLALDVFSEWILEKTSCP